ncbi:MAG: IS110 family transposase [Pseudonocardiaceae bacterium]
MSQRTRFLGRDVHAKTIAVAIADDAGPPEDYDAIANDPGALRKLVVRVGGDGVRLVAAYEAGATGFALHRQLTTLGLECTVVAPSLIPRRPGDRVKTDRRDALKLCRLLRSGDLTAVWVPDEEHEALRDLVRARSDAKQDEVRAKHRLSKLLLRRGITPPVGARPWTRAYLLWLDQLRCDYLADQIVLDDYRHQVRAARERVAQLDASLVQCAGDGRYTVLLRALQAFRGIGFLTAVTIVAEAGDMRRFATARQFMTFTGLVPSEYSSGAVRRTGHITRAGNRGLRHVLGESAHHARHVPALTTTLRRRQRGLPREITEASWRAQHRLHYRYLVGRLGKPIALTAIARELAGFIWGTPRVPVGQSRLALSSIAA